MKVKIVLWMRNYFIHECELKIWIIPRGWGGGGGGSWPSDIKRENLIKLFLCKPGKNREEEKERWRIIILFDRQI